MNIEQKYKTLIQNMLEMLTGYDFNGEYRESKEFETLVMETIIERSTSRETAIRVIKQDFLYVLFGDHISHGGIYKFLQNTVLPSLQKDRVRIEKSKQEKMELLATIFDVGHRPVEAHVIRTIIKPYIVSMNIRWAHVSPTNIVKNIVKLRYS